MSNAVQDAIAAAAAQAANSTPPATTQQNQSTGGGAVASVVPGKRRSIDDAMASAGAACDIYLKASDKSGMTFDKDEKFFESVDVEINLAECAFPYVVKWSNAGQTQYARSYDGIVEARSGKPWATAIQQAQAMDPKCTGQYDAVEFVGKLLRDYEGKTEKFEAGKRAGHTTSTTGTKFFMSWLIATVKDQGKDAVVKVRLNHKRIEKGSNKWGVIVPETIEENDAE